MSIRSIASFTLLLLLIVAVKGQDHCNICGQGNRLNEPTGSVEFEYAGGFVKLNCEALQKTVMNPNAISDAFCRNELLEYTNTVCKCTTPDGTLVADIYESPTTSPAPAGPTNFEQQNTQTTTTSMATTIIGSSLEVMTLVAATVLLPLYHC